MACGILWSAAVLEWWPGFVGAEAAVAVLFSSASVGEEDLFLGAAELFSLTSVTEVAQNLHLFSAGVLGHGTQPILILHFCSARPVGLGGWMSWSSARPELLCSGFWCWVECPTSFMGLGL